MSHWERKLTAEGVDLLLRRDIQDFSGDPVDKNPPANAEDMGLISDLGRFHMRGTIKPIHHTAEPTLWSLCSGTSMAGSCQRMAKTTTIL